MTKITFGSKNTARSEYNQFLQTHWERLGYKGNAPQINALTLLQFVPPQTLNRVVEDIFRKIAKITHENK